VVSPSVSSTTRDGKGGRSHEAASPFLRRVAVADDQVLVVDADMGLRRHIVGDLSAQPFERRDLFHFLHIGDGLARSFLARSCVLALFKFGEP
jgi:hypothetical protein